jgi:hydroxyacylglutathione hydrolase
MKELLPGLVRFESSLWETTSLLIHRDGVGVLVDPCISEAEVAAIASHVRERGVSIAAQLITHSDWDHICGIASFPGAPAVMGRETGEVIRSGEAAAGLTHAAAREGLTFSGSPRVDSEFESGAAIRVGPFDVETLRLPGHTDCSVAFRLRDPDILIVGDYLSSIEHPYVASSTAAYRDSLALMIEVLTADPPELVIPGHGRPLTPDEAVEIGRADLSYLFELRSVVGAALAEGADAIAAGASVVTPRPVANDEATRRENARLQLLELMS